MIDKVEFKISRENDIMYEEGNFKEKDKGIYLFCTIGSSFYRVMYLGKDIRALNKNTLIELLGPTNIHSLLFVNLKGIDRNEVLDAIDSNGEYYLYFMNEEYRINLLNKKETIEYQKDFEFDLKEAILKYGEENVTLVKDSELFLYHICCAEGDSLINFKDKYYSVTYISLNFLDKDISNFKYKYEFC